MHRIGIDPGITGAVAVLGPPPDFGCWELHDMPSLVLANGRRNVDGRLFAGMVDKWRAHWEAPGQGNMVAYLERVSAMPKQGVTSMFGFGRSFGIVEGVLLALHIPIVYVEPQHWKERAGLSRKDKDAARLLAIKLYPEQDLFLKKHIGRADALLIGRFGS